MLFNNENFDSEFVRRRLKYHVREPFMSVKFQENRVQQPHNSTTYKDTENKSDEVDLETVGSKIDSLQVPKDLLDKLINYPKYRNWDVNLREAVKRFKIERNIPLDKTHYLRIGPGKYITLPRFCKKCIQRVSAVSQIPIKTEPDEDGISESHKQTKFGESYSNNSTALDVDIENESDESDVETSQIPIKPEPVEDSISESFEQTKFIESYSNNFTARDTDSENESDEVDVVTVDPEIEPHCRQGFILPMDLHDKLINNQKYQNWDEDLKEAVKRFKIDRNIPLGIRYHVKIFPGRYITLPAFPEEDGQVSNTLKEQRVEQPHNSTTYNIYIEDESESDEVDVETVDTHKIDFVRDFVLPKKLHDKLINNPKYENWDADLRKAVKKFKIEKKIPLSQRYYLKIAPGRYITLPEFYKRERRSSKLKREKEERRKQQTSSDKLPGSSNMDMNRASIITQSSIKSKLGRIDSRSSKRRKIIGQFFPPVECQLSLLPKDLLVKLTNKRKFQDWDDDLKNAVKKFKMDNNFPLKRKVRIRIAPGEYIILPRFSEKEKHKSFCQHKKPVTCIHKKPVTCTHKKPLASAQLRSNCMVTSRSKQIHMGTSDQETQTDAKESIFEVPQVFAEVGPGAPDLDSEKDVVSLPSDVPSTNTLFDSDSEIDNENFPFTNIQSKFDSDSEIDGGDFWNIFDSEIDEVSQPSNIPSTITSLAKQVGSDAVFVPPASPPWSMPNDLRDKLMQNVRYQKWDEELKEAVREFKLKRKFPLEKTVRIRIAPETYITLPGFPEEPQRWVNSAQKAKLKSVMKTDKQLLKMKCKIKHCRCNLKKKADRR